MRVHLLTHFLPNRSDRHSPATSDCSWYNLKMAEAQHLLGVTMSSPWCLHPEVKDGPEKMDDSRPTSTAVSGKNFITVRDCLFPRHCVFVHEHVCVWVCVCVREPSLSLTGVR